MPAVSSSSFWRLTTWCRILWSSVRTDSSWSFFSWKSVGQPVGTAQVRGRSWAGHCYRRAVTAVTPVHSFRHHRAIGGRRLPAFLLAQNCGGSSLPSRSGKNNCRGEWIRTTDLQIPNIVH